MYWHNPSETWVDVEGGSNNVVSSIINMVSGDGIPRRDTHFISESGNLDFFVMLGPGPKDVLRQYAALTGATPLPQVKILVVQGYTGVMFGGHAVNGLKVPT